MILKRNGFRSDELELTSSDLKELSKGVTMSQSGFVVRKVDSEINFCGYTADQIMKLDCFLQQSHLTIDELCSAVSTDDAGRKRVYIQKVCFDGR